MSDKSKLHVVSFSGGKDSTALLLGMLEREMPVDIILFCDTGLEFPHMYEHIDKVEKNIGRKITRLHPAKPFEYWMFDHMPKRRSTSDVAKYDNCAGRSWAGPRSRWCTETLKRTPLHAFYRQLKDKYEIVEYVGIAADEQYRLRRKQNMAALHPLVDWNMTEADCLKYCYERGYDWGGLYEHFHRVSCWCCPLQSLAELRQLYKHFPDLWAKLKDWDNRTWRKLRADYNVEQLEERFKFEDECLKSGKPIKGKGFFKALRERLAVKQEVG